MVFPYGTLYQFYEEGKKGISANTFSYNSNYYFGSSQVSLNFDTNDNRFSFDYLHSPKYFQDLQSVGIENNYSIDSMSGICFRSLEPTTFWYDLLGFSSSLLVNTSSLETQVVLQPSINCTSNFWGVSSFLKKDGKTGMKNVSNTQDIYSATNDTQKIETANIWKNQLETNDGYYLLEIDICHSNTLSQKKITKNLMAVISRQFNQENFITAYTTGSIDWNITKDVVVSAIRVRILNPSTRKDANIGVANTIYLTVNIPPNNKEDDNRTEKKRSHNQNKQ